MLEIRRPGRSPAEYKFTALLAALVLFLAVNPFLAQAAAGEVLIFNTFVLLVLLANVYAATHRRLHLAAGALLALGAYLPLIAGDLADRQSLEAYAFACLGLLWLFSTGSILGHILTRRVVTVDTLAGAVCVYLQIGLVWSVAFVFVDAFVPGSFNFAAAAVTGPDSLRANYQDFVYFSFVTLTTAGYGDLLPVSAPARALAYLEAALGQIYLAVLVARLLGLHLAARQAG